MASPTQWTWVWVNSGSWWWTGSPGMLRFMGSKGVGHDWVTELNWTELLLFYATTTNHFSIGLWCVKKTGFYTTISNDQLVITVVELRRSFKALPKDKLAPETGSWSLLAVYCPSDPLQLSESWGSHYIREACSANQWDALKPTTPEAGTGQQNWPNSSLWQHVAQPVLQRLNKLGYKVLPHLPYSPDLSTIDNHFFKHLNNFFAGKMLTQPEGSRKCF